MLVCRRSRFRTEKSPSLNIGRVLSGGVHLVKRLFKSYENENGGKTTILKFWTRVKSHIRRPDVIETLEIKAFSSPSVNISNHLTNQYLVVKNAGKMARQ